KVRIYPKGCGKVFDSLSVYIYREDSTDFPVNAKYSFEITSQANLTNTGAKKSEGERQFSSTDRAWGFHKVMPLSQLHDPKAGYLVNDTCEIRIECSKIAVDFEKPVKEKAKHLSQAQLKPVKEGKSLSQAKPIVPSNTWYCIWFSCVTRHSKHVKEEGKHYLSQDKLKPVKEEGKHLSRAKPVVTSNTWYCIWCSCVTRHSERVKHS
ncbi:hypothetical protein MKW94_028712, partial [Papaver nudicaule]|nr:hypothetical protein [Papaver nudicaule]